VKCEWQNKEENMTDVNVSKDTNASNIAKLQQKRNNNEKIKKRKKKEYKIKFCRE
jgi:hypothetical protein